MEILVATVGFILTTVAASAAWYRFGRILVLIELVRDQQQKNKKELSDRADVQSGKIAELQVSFARIDALPAQIADLKRESKAAHQALAAKIDALPCFRNRGCAFDGED